MECLRLVTKEKKFLRTDYFRMNPWFRRMRHEMGQAEFDGFYHGVYSLLSRMYFDNYIIIGKVCRKKPEYHDVVLSCCDVYYHMDYFVNLEYDRDTDTLTVRRPAGPYQGYSDHYWPPDVYSLVMRHPGRWGINIEDITLSII